MQYFEKWQELPYYPISLFYREKFGEKVYKIPVSVSQTCPNREGLKGMKTCVFCDVWGSAAYPEVRDQVLKDQILTNKERIRKRFNANKFLVYFQAYTNSFAKSEHLRQQFEVAEQVEDVVGFVVGTRPDCLSPAVLRLWQEYAKKHFLSVELGVQTFDEKALVWMERGHSAVQSIKAILKIKELGEVDLGIHLMFGLPGETDEFIKKTARIVNSLPIDNVKLHNLHVLSNTPLEEMYKKGEFVPISREDYTRRVQIFLEHLNPNTAVHRVAAVASRHDELVAPYWAASKLDNYQFIIDKMREQNSYQGKKFVSEGKGFLHRTDFSGTFTSI
ncbi:MAG: TIGR01212 family radical SAM protein [Bdellovibrionales bacterium]|nr:TIGR01212 family radical SAM protein [Bdellovibrionales bacterium]